MKRVCFVLFIFMSISVFGKNKVSIETRGNELVATIYINDGEYIELDDNFLYLTIESDKYNFIFSGYPDGEVGANGDIKYRKELTLSGELLLKPGIPKKEYTINAILGFQTCSEAGFCNIPVEISQDILVNNSPGLRLNLFYIAPVVFLIFLIFAILLFIKKRKR